MISQFMLIIQFTLYDKLTETAHVIDMAPVRGETPGALFKKWEFKVTTREPENKTRTFF